MAGLKYTILCITAVCWGSVLSASTTWKKAMTTCRNLDQLPSFEEDTKKNGSWVGKVKYSFPWGTGILQIERVKKNETCSDCDAQTKQCEFCNSTIQLNGSVASLEVLRTLKPRRKYILDEFGKQAISGIPPPYRCMVHRGASHTDYVDCNEKFEDGCNDLGDIFDTYITICVDVYATTQADVNFSGCTSQQGNDVNKDCSLLSCLLCLKYLLIIVGGILVLIVFDVMCIYCCVRCNVKRKLRAIQKEKTNEHRSRPISEAITRIYRHMNNFEDQHNSGYDLVVNMSKKANFNALSEANACEDYDRGFFRLASHSGDYDKAWCTNWSSAPSPESDYAEVQKISKQLMVTVPEEEIYSKQRLDPESIATDVTRSCGEREESPNKDPTGSSSQTWVVNEDEGNGGMNQPDEQTNQQANAEGTSETIKLEKRESENDKHGVQELKTQRERLINNTRAEIHLKKARGPIETVSGDKDTNSSESNEIREKNDKMESKKKDKKVRRSKPDMKSKSENSKTVATCTTEAGKMVNEETAILIESMNNITSKTKL